MSLSDHLRSGRTTIAYCWVVTRQDGTVLGFTDHDQSITVDGYLCSATTGVTTTRLSQSLGLSADDLEVDGVIDDDAIRAEDLRAGVYDNASVIIYLANHEDPTQFEIMARGQFGSVLSTDNGAFKTEFRSLTYPLGQSVGRAYQRTCDAKLGDDRCGVNINTSEFTGAFVVSKSSTRHVELQSVVPYADEWFSLGKLITDWGEEVGVRTQTGTTVNLWHRLSRAPQIGSTITLVAGCQKDVTTCKNKFGNFVNFQGFPLMPGNDKLTDYPVRGKGRYVGESLFNPLPPPTPPGEEPPLPGEEPPPPLFVPDGDPTGELG
jgi:uncharacterized phage protein (TIGR02218 family)